MTKTPATSCTGFLIGPMVAFVWKQIITGESPFPLAQWGVCMVCFAPAERYAVVTPAEPEPGHEKDEWKEQVCNTCWFWVLGIYERSPNGSLERNESAAEMDKNTDKGRKDMN